MSIKIQNLSVEFNQKVKAIDDVSLTIHSGIYGLLGENGAGKTTLMRVLTTILKPTGGEVVLDKIPYRESNYTKIQKRIGYLPQELNLYPNLTVRECLEYLGELAGVTREDCKKRIDFYLDKTNLAEHQKKKIRQLSGGMKRRVGLIQALLHDPECLIIDEPTTGLDPEERIRIRNLLVDFSVDRTVLFSTHVVEDLAATCNQLAVMKKGKLRYQGEMRTLIQQAEGHVWVCCMENESEVRLLEESYHVTSKQYSTNGMVAKVISEHRPAVSCEPAEVTLEDAYIYVSNL